MKKIIAIFLITLLSATFFASCRKAESSKNGNNVIPGCNNVYL